ncbi:MAG: cysteine--tRNA ligase [Actinomycetota bacterium]|nr:cysteine--tRNA ligase [Actinomycetota bacterium]
MPYVKGRTKIKLYNTLTRRKEELEPRVEGEISMYACGPTVYNPIHIGNARTFINFDMIRRYLEYRGHKVTFVRNITDIDDKIINRAAEEETTPKVIAEKYEAVFHADMARLGVTPPTHEPKATEMIPEMVDLVKILIERGLAYEVGGNVWFRVREFKDYGKLSGRSLDEMRAGKRVEPDPGKEDPMDFALWKRSKPGEPSWESPWGPGRPGWHLECSAMSLKLLGPGFDIHGGAQDLIFPHHENEIAQSEGATGEEFVRYWVHAGLLNLDKEKMSKSLGNVMLLGDLLKQWSPNTVRMLMLGTHYRNPLDFTREGLMQAQANVEKIERTIENIDFALGLELPVSRHNTLGLRDAVHEARAHFVSAMNDDLNTAEALPAIFNLVKEANSVVEGADELPVGEALHKCREELLELTDVLGLDLEPQADWLSVEAPLRALAGEVLGPLPTGVSREGLLNALLERRAAARADREWSVSDRIRDSLAATGIEIEDTSAGPRWKLVRK